MRARVLLTFILYAIIFFNISAQSVRGEQSEIRELIVNANNVSTVLFNYGSIGKPNYLPGTADFVWKDLGYMFEFGPIIAAEVQGENNEILHICSDSFVNPGQGDYSPDGTVKWGWLPTAGYLNPNSQSIANYNDPDSWPDSWAEWPDKMGTGTSDALNEAYYVMDDFTNAEFDYYPFGPEDERRGLGVQTEVRIYQYGDQFSDAVIIEYNITNVSDKDLNKVYWGFTGDPHVGGSDNYSDDVFGLVHKNKDSDLDNSIYFWDKDMTGDHGLPAGILGFKLLTTPDDMDLTALQVAPYTNSDPNVPRNDPLIWQWFTDGIDSTSEFFSGAPGDQMFLLGTGPFELKSGESTQVKLAIYLSDDFSKFFRSTKYITNHHYWPALSSEINTAEGNEDYKIEFDINQSKLSGDFDINWNYTGTDENAEVYIECSPNLGEDWYYIAKANAADQSYSWNTKDFQDGANYSLRIISFNPSERVQYYYRNSAQSFTIDNPEKNSKPELKNISELFDTTFTTSPVEIRWTSEDADNESLKVLLEYSLQEDGEFTAISQREYSNGYNSFLWNLDSVSNWNNYYLRITCSDGNSDTSLTTGPFEINFYQSVLTSNSVRHVRGGSTAEVSVQIIDPSETNTDEYRITFRELEAGNTYTLKNITRDEIVFEDLPLINKLSSMLFDGLKLSIYDKGNKIDHNLTTFNRKELNSIFNIYFNPSGLYLGNPKIPSSENWIVVFNNLNTTSDGSWINIGDEIDNVLSGVYETIKCPFHIINIDSMKPANYIIGDFIENGQWDSEETIVLRRQNAEGSETSYALVFDLSQENIPGNGDTLYIITDNKITEEDVYHFSVDSNFVVSVQEDKIISAYKLHQNYPNPFNPTTRINYELPSDSKVKLSVFNILGEEIVTLVNSNQKAGFHSTDFSAHNLSTGVYIYTLRVNDKLFSKKMLLMK